MTSSDPTPDQPNDLIPQHSGLANQLRGLWTTMTGQAQIVTGAQWGDAELFFSGVVTVLRGRLQTAVGEQQAQLASDALRAEWSGLNEETKGKILRQWGERRDDLQAMANGVVDLMQRKLDRYVGAHARQAGTPVSDAALAVGDQAADHLRQALTASFAGNAA